MHLKRTDRQSFLSVVYCLSIVKCLSSRKTNLVHGRRLRKHENRVAKMRQSYGLETRDNNNSDPSIFTGNVMDAGDEGTTGKTNRRQGGERDNLEGDMEYEEEEGAVWDDEAQQLYKWTQNLSVEQI